MGRGLTDNEQGGFREGRGSIDQIFTLKKISEEKRSVLGVYRFGEGIR